MGDLGVQVSVCLFVGTKKSTEIHIFQNINSEISRQQVSDTFLFLPENRV